MAFGPSHEYEVPVIQYVRSGRHDIAYQSFGSGDLDLVFTPNCVGSRRTSPIESAPAFDSATRAVQCASALQHAAHHRGLTIRAGLHTGECEETADGDIAGIAVHVAARVQAIADADEIIVTSTLKDLVLGSGLPFAPRGEHTLKGIPGPWTLWQVPATR